MVIGYMLFATGELFMSPVGLSKVTELSPARIVSFMMGVWFLSSAFAFRLVGFVSSKLAVGGTSADGTQGLASLDVYTEGFWTIAQVTLVGALVAFVIAPIMKKWMHGVH
jgi:POT family proton-dependent oligopeptide transporter